MEVSIATTINVTKSSETGFPISCHVTVVERRTPMAIAYAFSGPDDRVGGSLAEISGDISMRMSPARVGYDIVTNGTLTAVGRPLWHVPFIRHTEQIGKVMPGDGR